MLVVLLKMFKIIWGIEEVLCLERERHKKCTTIFLRDKAKIQVFFTKSKWMKIEEWTIVFGQMLAQTAYQYFGDVTFDAIYLTNCYNMPFVPFTRVDHHHQFMMFGYALLINETVESYTWLLKTWLEAMLGCAPSTIITDDDKAIDKANFLIYNNLH